jgi:hypothetical protein
VGHLVPKKFYFLIRRKTTENLQHAGIASGQELSELHGPFRGRNFPPVVETTGRTRRERQLAPFETGDWAEPWKMRAQQWGFGTRRFPTKIKNKLKKVMKSLKNV